MALNVNRAVTDPFYRYKMPRIQAKVEGKGNGIKTVISNMVEIAKALERPPIYSTKYFGIELGAQTQVDVRNERYIVNGEHDAAKLQDILDGFIKKYVLCPACDNPETTLTVRKQQINSKCKACGHSFVIDPRHRLSTFIVKNPPKIEVDLNGDIKEKKISKTNGTNGNEAPDDTNGSKHGSSSGEEAAADVDDGDWAPELENEQLAEGISKLVITPDLEKSVPERLDMLYKYFQDKKNKNEIGEGQALLNEAERLELKPKAALVLANVIFDANIVNEKQVEQYKTCLKRFTYDDDKAKRYLLGGIEQVIIKHETVLLPRAPHILKALYDAEICDEDSILKWAEKPTHRFVQKNQSKAIIAACDIVIQWLKEAEEESSSEEEDDDINFSNDKTSRLAAENKKRVQPEVTVVKDDDGEEIAIEDI